MRNGPELPPTGAPQTPIGPSSIEAPTLREAIRVWARIGVLSFGGPAGQIALMHEELVERRAWIDSERFLHALNYCMLLPGPEAQQLATYIGFLIHGTPGGLAAGLLFVLPGALLMGVLSALYAVFHMAPAVAALFFGLKAAVFAVVLEAVLRIGKRALRSRVLVAVAGLAFVALFFFAIPFPFVVLAAGAFGFIGSRVAPWTFPPSSVRGPETTQDSLVSRMAAAGELKHTTPSARRALYTLLVFGAAWALPLACLRLALGPASVYVREGVFFSQAAVLTFGGAYAVLAYVAQAAVDEFHWLAPGEMLDGLGLAETTPGPLILVLQFVGFLGAYRDPGTLPPLLAGFFGSFVTLWATFAPCFLMIFIGAPYIELLRGHRSINAALASITAAVVGVILNLGVWFGLHVLFRSVTEIQLGPLHMLAPSLASIDLGASTLAAIALLCLMRFKLGLPKTLALSTTLGFAMKLLLGFS